MSVLAVFLFFDETGLVSLGSLAVIRVTLVCELFAGFATSLFSHLKSLLKADCQVLLYTRSEKVSNVDHIEGMVLVVKSRGALSNFGEDGYSLFSPPVISAQLQDQKKAPQQPKACISFPSYSSSVSV